MEKEKEHLKRQEEIQRKMQMQAYQPPQMYLEKHKDPSFFNYEYQQYYDGLKNDVDKGYGKPLNP